MNSLLSYQVGEERLILSSEHTLFWENTRTLILADLHVGKTGHFRKAGIGVPQTVYKDDLHRLLSQLLFFKAERLIIVGDLSHSIANREMDLFRKWRLDFPSLEVHLAKGNHDILDNRWYQEANIHVHNDPFTVGSFVFVHDVFTQSPENSEGKYIFSGHVHPGVVIRGKGKQSLRFPCFYFNEEYCILPAFSKFTGTYTVSVGSNEDVFAIVGKDLVKVNKQLRG